MEGISLQRAQAQKPSLPRTLNLLPRAVPQFLIIPGSAQLLICISCGALTEQATSLLPRELRKRQDNLNTHMDKPPQGEPSSEGKRHTERVRIITHHFPCKSLVPEGGTFFQTKKSASNWGSKGSCNPCSCSSRYKIPLISEMKRKTISV